MKTRVSFTSPQLSTLRSQTAAILKEAILGGQWLEHLPSEAELCRLYKVGRDTVRSAVMDLAAQNLVTPGGKGRNHKIIPHPAMAQTARRIVKPTRIIRFLSNEAFHHLGELTTTVFNAIETKLAERGYKLVFEHEPGIYARFSKTRMEQIASRSHTVGWILFRTTRQVQTWFQDRGIPAVITGSAHPGVTLATVQLGLQAVCRHAALKFLEYGHHNVAFVTPFRRIATEEESLQGFLSLKRERPDVRFSLIEHDHSMNAIIKGILASRLGKEPVTGYLIMEPQVAVTTLTILQFSGIPVPGAASIIARYGDTLMSQVLPAIAHYRFDGGAHGRLVTKVLLSSIEHGHSASQSIGGFSKFVAGGSLGRV